MSALTIAEKISNCQPEPLRAVDLNTLQVNLGYRCNMSCKHCHVGSGPARTETMGEGLVEAVIDVLEREEIGTLDITGGAPELNPHFRLLVERATRLGRNVMVRTNLTIFFEPGMEGLPEFYAENGVEVVASLPYYKEENVDRVRGAGTFQRSIAALRKLNSVGYGTRGKVPPLVLVANPQGAFLPPPQASLEADMRKELLCRFGISFNRLQVLANMPVGRFRDFLVRTSNLERYLDRAAAGFNPATLEGIMCRHLVSVGPDGRLYDCDFNQMIGTPLLPEYPQHIGEFNRGMLSSRTIALGDHCAVCMAGQGYT